MSSNPATRRGAMMLRLVVSKGLVRPHREQPSCPSPATARIAALAGRLADLERLRPAHVDYIDTLVSSLLANAQRRPVA